MKKKKVNLSKKLFLDKETIARLNTNQRENVMGGADTKETEWCDTRDECKTHNEECGTGCACPPTVPTWGIACGCTDNNTGA